jgi:hypothetical protein
MADRNRLSRELSEDELPDDVSEALEEGRAIHRRRPDGERRAGGSEEKTGAEEEEERAPSLKARQIKPPPVELPKE